MGVWDISTQKAIFGNHDFSGFGLVPFLPDNRTLVIPHPNGMVGLWDVLTGKKVREFQTVGDAVWGVGLEGKVVVVRSTFKRIGPDKMTLPGTDPRTVHVYDLVSGKLRATIESENKIFFPRVVAGGKTLLTLGGPSAPQWWDLSTGKEIAGVHGYTGGSSDATAVSADGQKIAVGSGNRVTLWTWEEAREHK